MRMTVAVLALLAALVWDAAPAAAQTDSPLVTARYDPRLQFRVLATPRADIYFHQGEDTLARRLATIIDEVAPDVDRRLGAPRGRLRVILVDQTDQSNGWATVVPYNLIEIAAVPPAGGSMIGNTDDWLRLVFTHEYTHVVHLEKSGGWLGSLRHVFGRLPLFYPNLFLPDWQIEGLATYQESEITGQGRVPAGDFRMILDTAAAAGRFAPLDRATSAVIDWPRGASSYLYGAYFHQYLAERFGAGTLTRLAEETAGRLPFAGSRAFKKIYAESLGDLWRDFERETTQRAAHSGQGAARERLTRHGFTVTSPAFTPDGRLFYSISNPHGFPALMERRADGSSHEITSRYLGNRLAASGNRLVFDQLEFDGPVALYSDLYLRSLDDGETRRLTRGARAADPDVSADGHTIVCTVQEAGRRLLATTSIPPPGEAAVLVPLVSADATEFASPRWSPDGRLIVAERRRLGRPGEIVVIDPATREVRPLVSPARGRAISPMWLPDGSAVIFSSDHEGGPFTLYAADILTGALSRVADAGVGAQSPAISPDGTRLVFVGYSADGYDLFALPWSASRLEPAPALPLAPAAPATAQPEHTAQPARTDDAVVTAPPYRPWPTLAPRFWVPIIETDGDDTVVGATTAGFDALGRHAYTLSAGWAIPRNRADVQLDYAYTRWWPVLFAGVSDDTDSWRAGTVRSRDLTAGVLLPWRRVRSASSVLAAFNASSDDFDCSACAEPVATVRRRQAGRLGAAVSNARGFGYSISAEQGGAANVITEFARGTGGGSASSVAAELRGYQRVFPRHGVVAVRLAGAISRGDAHVRREFSAAGSAAQPGGYDIGLDAIGLLRGFGADDLSGRKAAVANLDYRFPIAWPQRGLGTWPVFLRAVHGAVFADAAHAWDDGFERGDVRHALGGELSVDMVFGGSFPVTVAAGGAWRHDPAGVARGGAAFLRLGRAF